MNPPPPHLRVHVHREQIWRVGFTPNPWAWTPWKYADPDTGCFTGRWDSPTPGAFRTCYAGSTLRGCLLEVLAAFRADDVLTCELNTIVDNDGTGDTAEVQPGALPRQWLDNRVIGGALLTGEFIPVTTTNALTYLRRQHLQSAQRLGLADLDASALRGEHRDLTQAIAAHLHDAHLDGVTYGSRHGDEHQLWAIWEHEQSTVSSCLADSRTVPLSSLNPDLVDAMSTLGLRWTDRDPDMPAPLAQSTHEQAFRAMFPPDGTPDTSTPLGAAVLWYDALTDGDIPALRRLVWHPSAWDWPAAQATFNHLGLKQNVEYPYHEDPDIALVGFINAPVGASQAFDTAPVDTTFLIVVRARDQWWVWGYSDTPNYVVPLEEIRPPEHGLARPI